MALSPLDGMFLTHAPLLGGCHSQEPSKLDLGQVYTLPGVQCPVVVVLELPFPNVGIGASAVGCGFANGGTGANAEVVFELV
jgi:hypothetical protein